jgi:hypothetical protein
LSYSAPTALNHDFPIGSTIPVGPNWQASINALYPIHFPKTVLVDCQGQMSMDNRLSLSSKASIREPGKLASSNGDTEQAQVMGSWSFSELVGSCEDQAVLRQQAAIVLRHWRATNSGAGKTQTALERAELET